MNITEIYCREGGELKEFKKFSGEIDVGYKIEYEKKLEEIDVLMFALLSGDFNPIHFDEVLASKTKFSGRVVHGMLTTSLISAAVARMPGIVVLLENHFKYTRPVRIGDTVRVEGVVVEKEGKKYKVNFKCSVGKTLVAEGLVKIAIWENSMQQ